MIEKTIIYDSRRFTIGTAGRYYFATVKGKSKSLHRYKYEKEKGVIPAGWHVHHSDGNCFNNETENLVAIEPKAHLRLHPNTPEQLRKWQEAGVKAARLWPGSQEGVAFHKRHYENMKDKLHARFDRDCSNCGKKISSNKKTNNTFCSNNCKSAYRRKNNPDYTIKNCLTCKIEFKTKKYNGADYCCKECRPAPNPLGYQARFKT